MRRPPPLRPTWIEVSLSAVAANLRALKAACGDAKVLFVVKANAYGHGAARLAQFAQERGLCDFFGVSSVEEGLELRACGVTLPVLVLGSIYPFSAFEAALERELSVTVASLDAALGVASAAARLGKTARCHIKVDTGMGRIGSRRPGAVKIAQFLADSPSAKIEGIYTHFSSPDSDPAFTRRQLKRFNDTLADCAALGLKTGLRHAASSYPAVHIPESRFDMVRPGLAVYGLLDGFQPALSLKTRIVFLKDACSGASISYCRSFRARKPMRVATIPVGYGDGYARRLSKRGAALVNGARARILGNVTMDMTMIDVTDVPDAEVGGEVVLIGEQNGERISAQDIAALTGTISYETVTALAARVPRLYTR